MNFDPKLKWEECRNIIRHNISPEQYEMLFAYTEFKEYADNSLILSIPSQFIYDMLERDEYVKLIAATLKRVFGTKINLSYCITVVKQPVNNIIVEASEKLNVINGNNNHNVNKTPDTIPLDSDEIDSQLHQGYTFNSFIEGESNKLARSIGQAIALNLARTFNPFFVFGPSGCGKTHLVNAIGWKIKEIHPQLRVLYLSAHLFTVQYTDSVRQNKTNDFINFYQTIDVLILDDVQELSGRTATQNTFFHIFNHLHMNGKQIILTADRPPVKIEGLEDRLLTRFRWGLQAEIEKPTKALRKKILNAKIKKEGLDIPDDVVEYISSNLDNNIRDLEGIIRSLMAYSVVYNCDISKELVDRIIPHYVERNSDKFTTDDIKRVVCDFFKISEDVLCSSSRKQEIVYVRQLTMYLANRHTEDSHVQIGKSIGGRNHSTVIHSIKQVNNLIDTEPKTKIDIDAIEKQLNK
jgi:chromosomal replication initiator protein